MRERLCCRSAVSAGTSRARGEGRARKALVIGPNAGHSLAFLRDEAPIFYLDVATAGSQFRSRDFLPAVVGRHVAGDRGSICEPVPPELVPRVPPAVVAYTDGYGSLKTTLDERPAANGERVLVRLGAASATAIVSDGSFSVAEGELALAPGSSGWPLRDGGERRLLELFLRGGSASAASATPRPARRRRQPTSGVGVGRHRLLRAACRCGFARPYDGDRWTAWPASR
jgi:hypothetical protein